MISSTVDLCNQALARIGVEPIADLLEASAPAIACRLLYGPTRDSVLRMHHWSFAGSRARLASLDVSADGRWGGTYALPSDCIQARRLETAGAGQPPPPYEIRGRRLLTDQAEPVLLYTRRVEDPVEFDPLFVQALSARLAADLVMPLQGDRDTWRLADTAFVSVMDAARAADSRAATPSPQTEPSWIQVRN